MKNLYIIFTLCTFSFFNSQGLYEKELKQTKSFVKTTLRNEPSKIIEYVKLTDGRLKQSMTENPVEEFELQWEMFYKILRKNNKIVYISKSDDLWGHIGDSKTSYDYYFNEEGILVGAEKSLDFFLLDTTCTNQVKYYVSYINVKAEKLEKKEIYKDDKGNVIDFTSKKCKNSKRYIHSITNDLDKITFRDVEGFMKAEKIKYYQTDKNETPETKKNIEYEKENHAIGYLIKGRTQGNENAESKIGVERKLIGYIPGTMGRGGIQPSHSCTARGSIMIAYTIDKAGDVVSARRSGGVLDSCITSTSIGWIKKYVKAEKANVTSMGTYRITF
ncbi:hypothetical protein [Chryseobacterium daeguense]|uniref:hypothetical protein n=1 Tax=Chryseobacterium daeguense TaxID=412438 RepID=UPI000406AD0A|nr:hypothetical protein [Chryseobacterium daeguense]